MKYNVEFDDKGNIIRIVVTVNGYEFNIHPDKAYLIDRYSGSVAEYSMSMVSNQILFSLGRKLRNG